ncbi:hypothetical protein [Mesorhizobium sp. CAU 1741]|uniref:hypothetical protein n=1 Tax=Mesorhizobium sp. CAU 1741 TaxID=3140366 RepID=UPI00325AB908
MSYRDWHVGMKVVFIGVPDGFTILGQLALKTGRVYVVEELEMHCKGDIVGGVDGLPYVVANEALYVRVEGTFYHAACFRPVQPRKTDISLFTSMLNGAKEREPT